MSTFHAHASLNKQEPLTAFHENAKDQMTNPHLTTRPLDIEHRPHVVLVNTWRVVDARGGVEKMFCTLANALSLRGWRVTALCADEQTGRPGFELSEAVNFINAGRAHSSIWRKLTELDPNRNRRARNRMLRRLREISERVGPAIEQLGHVDIFVSFQFQTTTLLKDCLCVKAPIVTMLHADPPTYTEDRQFPLQRKAVANSATLQVLLPEYVESARRVFQETPITVIPNPAPVWEKQSSLTSPVICTVARIEKVKRPELAVRAFGLLKDRFPDWTYEWWGETQINERLTAQIRTLISEIGLEERFILKGTTNAVGEKLLNASIFLLPSEVEGFPLSLAEAMSAGLPLVGCAATDGVNALIRNGENGFLCGDTPESIAESLARLMEDADLRRRLGAQAKIDASAYAPDTVWERWDELLRSIIANSK